MKKIRAVRSGVDTGVNKSGNDFWNSIPSDMLRKVAYNADVVRACLCTIVPFSLSVFVTVSWHEADALLIMNAQPLSHIYPHIETHIQARP